MPNNPHNWLQMLALGLFAVGAGALDFLHGVHTGRRKWHFLAFILHLCLALLTGSLAVMIVTELGYSIYAAGAAAGGAGFMNVRLFELFEHKARHWGGTKSR